MKIYSSINEFLANSPKPGVRPEVKPGVYPVTKPTDPKFPSPIRRDKPSVKPDTKAGIENEFLANSPKPGVRPEVKPGVSPGTKPTFPTPIRPYKPSVKPDPKAGIETILPIATEEELIAKLISNLRSDKKEIEVNLGAIKNRYKK